MIGLSGSGSGSGYYIPRPFFYPQQHHAHIQTRTIVRVLFLFSFGAWKGTESGTLEA